MEKTQMKFRLYNDGGDKLILSMTDENGKETREENDFTFIGFSNDIHPYNRKRINWLVKILATKGIILNIIEVSTVDKMFIDTDGRDLFDYDNINLPTGSYNESEDGNTYILFQDTEMGRGWTTLLKNKEILTGEHRDSVLDEIESGKFIRSFDIDYETVRVEDLDKI